MPHIHKISPLLAEFYDQETEKRFNENFVPARLRLFRVVAILAAAAYLASIWTDYVAFGPSPELKWLATTRVSLAILFVIAALSVNLKNIRVNVVILVAQISVGIAEGIIQTIHDGATGEQISSFVIIFSLYIMAHNRLVLSMIAGCFFGAVNIVSVHWLQPSVDLTFNFVLLIAMANLFGALVWRQANIFRRREFISYEEVFNSRANLVAEVKLRQSIEDE